MLSIAGSVQNIPNPTSLQSTRTNTGVERAESGFKQSLQVEERQRQHPSNGLTFTSRKTSALFFHRFYR